MYILPAISHPAGLETRFLFSHVEEEIVEIWEDTCELVASTTTQVRDNVIHFMIMEKLITLLATARQAATVNSALGVNFSAS
jgi:hypothetical protein